MSQETEWNSPEVPPENLNRRNDWFSVDVLIYSPKDKTHTIGWFDFQKMEWIFLVREARKEWQWRYFDERDVYKQKPRIRSPDPK